MKKFGLIGIIALIAIMGLAMTACDPLLEEGEIFIDVIKNSTISNVRGYMIPADAYTGGTNNLITDTLEVNSTGIILDDYSIAWKMGDMPLNESNNKRSIIPTAKGIYTVTVTKDENIFVSDPITVELVPNYYEFLGVWYMNSKNNESNSSSLPGATDYMAGYKGTNSWDEKFIVYYDRIVEWDTNMAAGPGWVYNITDWALIGSSDMPTVLSSSTFKTGYKLNGSTDDAKTNEPSLKGWKNIGLYIEDSKNYLKRSSGETFKEQNVRATTFERNKDFQNTEKYTESPNFKVNF